MMLGSLIPINSVVFIPNDGLVAFHYSSYGTFCLHSKSSIISTVVLPTTEIIEPQKNTRYVGARRRLYRYNKKLQTRYNKGVQANCKAKGEKYGTKGS